MRSTFRFSLLHIFFSSLIFLSALLFTTYLVLGDVHATDVTLYSTNDATILSSPDGNSNYGNQINVAVGYSTVNHQFRYALVKFDVSSIPTNATISIGRFLMYPLSCSGSMTPNLIRLNQITGPDWDEATVTFNNAPLLSSLDTGITRSGDCNIGGYMGFDVIPVLQDWLAGQPNYGLIVYSSATSSTYTRYFASKEGAAHQPQLSISYTTPSPTPSPTPTFTPTITPTTSAGVTVTINPTVTTEVTGTFIVPTLEPTNNTLEPLSPLIAGWFSYGSLLPCVLLICVCLLLVVMLVVIIKLLSNRNKQKAETSKPVEIPEKSVPAENKPTTNPTPKKE
jgi:hypothetical protein